MSDIDWNEEEEDWNGHDDVPPIPFGPRETEPILDTTVKPKPTGPLFGDWERHIAWLKRQEVEHMEALSIIRADIKAAGQRRKEEGNG